MKNMFRILTILFAISCLGSGCLTKHRTYTCPADIKTLCNNARLDAKYRIEKVNSKALEEKKDGRLTKHKGTRKFGSEWAWFDNTYWNLYVCGLCHGSWIEVACNPLTGEVSSQTVHHEWGHFWLISNYNDWSHNPKYASCFAGWREARNYILTYRGKPTKESVDIIRKDYQSMNEGEHMGVTGMDEDGSVYHIDFIVIKNGEMGE